MREIGSKEGEESRKKKRLVEGIGVDGDKESERKGKGKKEIGEN